jgi:hypothetical protein
VGAGSGGGLPRRPALERLCHHVLFRSRGGENAHANRITVCAWHHLRGIHAGVVRAWGEAPDEITWEIGARSGRRPLLRVEGVRLT